MCAGISTYEIRAARCSIDNKSVFLQMLRATAEKFNIHLICFNADMLAGRKHAESAVLHAVRSFEAGNTISNTLEMEALLYAAGSRQCNVAASFGIHEGENHLWVCSYPHVAGWWEALTPPLRFHDAKSWDNIDFKKRELLMQLYGITREELESVGTRDRIVDLVLERVALLDVLR